jgi:hypothetical protein
MLISTISDRLIVMARREKILEILAKTKAPYHFNIESCIEKGDNCEITDVKLKDHQTLTYLKGYKYPIKGYSVMETVAITAFYKKIIPLLAKQLKEQNWLMRIITIWALVANQKVWSKWLERLFAMGAYLLKEEYYQHSTQELRRVLNKYIDPQFVNAIGLVWEFDNAYRYRGQDILPLIKKERLQGYFQARREVLRVLSIYLERDAEQPKGKMENIVKLVGLAMLVPKINKLVRNIINDLNMKKIGFDAGDRYWVKKRTEKYKYNV